MRGACAPCRQPFPQPARWASTSVDCAITLHALGYLIGDGCVLWRYAIVPGGFTCAQIGYRLIYSLAVRTCRTMFVLGRCHHCASVCGGRAHRLLFLYVVLLNLPACMFVCLLLTARLFSP